MRRAAAVTLALAFISALAYASRNGHGRPQAVLLGSTAAAGGGGGGTPFTLVQKGAETRTGGAGATGTVSLSNVAANDLIVVAGGVGGAITSVVDQSGNAYTKAKTHSNGVSMQAFVYIFPTTASYSGTYNITITANGSVPITASASEFTTPNASPIDVSTGTSGTSASPASGTSPTTDSNCSLAVGAFCNDSGSNTSITGPAGWGQLFAEPDGVNWLVAGVNFSTGAALNSTTVAPTWGHGSANWAACVATFKN